MEINKFQTEVVRIMTPTLTQSDVTFPTLIIFGAALDLTDLLIDNDSDTMKLKELTLTSKAKVKNDLGHLLFHMSVLANELGFKLNDVAVSVLETMDKKGNQDDIQK